jgi:hypothetical protein
LYPLPLLTSAVLRPEPFSFIFWLFSQRDLIYDMGIDLELPTGGAVVYDANGTLKRGEGNTKTHKRDSTTASEIAFITGGGTYRFQMLSLS